MLNSHAAQARWDDAIAVLETSLVEIGGSGAATSPWTTARQLPLHPDVLYRLVFQHRFGVHLNRYITFKRLIRRLLDAEIAWRPWFNIRRGACGERRNRPRACDVLDAHAKHGVAALHAFADDFSYMTPLQTLMLASDSQACRQAAPFLTHWRSVTICAGSVTRLRWGKLMLRGRICSVLL
jgi:hypothetical protein